MRRFVQGCRLKEPTRPTSRHDPSADCSCSHLGVDFITDLPPSDGNTCILVVIDQFSKSCRLLPLKGIPTEMVTAELFFNLVFRYTGIPEDIVSDQGP